MPSTRRALVASLALAASSLAGCLQTDGKTTLNADGSGTSIDVTTVDVARTKELLDFYRMMGGQFPGFAPLPQDFDAERWMVAQFGKEALEAQAKAVAGVTVTSASSEVVDGKRVAKREIAFTDFSVLRDAVFQTTTAELAKNEDGTWTLAMDVVGMVRGFIPAAPPPGAAPSDPAAGGLGGFGFDPKDLLAMIIEKVGDLRFKRTFTLPGTIVETNGTKAADGRTVSWTFAIKDLEAAAADPANAPGKMTVRFRGENLTLKPFKYAPSMKGLFRAKPPAPAAPTTPAPTPAPNPTPDPTPAPKAPEPAAK
jgi:hypothetical protein